jgi:Protein of unknown function (DUF2891)
MISLDAASAERFAALALECIHREYPNKISHVLNSDGDVRPPRELTPAFYGCYDWHSAVHNHWLIIRLVRLFPAAGFVPAAIQCLRRNLMSANVAQELAYLLGEGRAAFERPYGLAWLLRLCQELREWRDDLADELLRNLIPLEQAVVSRLSEWLAKLPSPVRTGEHNQTAFALGLMIDYGHGLSDTSFSERISNKTCQFYLHDANYQIAYEPSGEDFLSPGLAEADAMRRVLAPTAFSDWLSNFLPQLGATGNAVWLNPVTSPDPSDPKCSHLNGLNLSRAWMLKGIAAGLPPDDFRIPSLLTCANAHAEAGLNALSGNHYVGTHWLGTFAVYLLTHCGTTTEA